MSNVRVFGRDAQRRVHSHIRRQARQLASQRPPLRGLGDLPHERFARGSRPHLCIANQRLFGQILQASNDGGKTWFQPGVKPEDATPQWPPVKSNRFAYDASAETGKPLTTHQCMTARSIHGNSNASGTSNRRSLTPTPSTLASKMQLSSAPPTAASVGTSSPACAATAPVPTGSRSRRHVPPHHHSRPHQSRSHLPRISAAGAFRTDDAGNHGSPLTKASSPTPRPIPPPKSVTACTTSPCIHPAPTCSSCRSIGRHALRQRG